VITAEVAQFVSGFRLQDAPPELKAAARRHLIDSLGVMLAGKAEHAAVLALRHAQVMSGTQLAPPLFAFVLGVRGHVLDYDDIQLPSRPEGVYGLLTHPSVPVLAACLALGRWEGSTGADLLQAFIAATEAECRLTDAIDPKHYRSGFHSSGTIGCLGAALAASRLMQLDEDRTRTAIGIAASSAAGLRENFGTMTKALHVGRAAQHGVEAAYLAHAGWTASKDVLEAQRGFYRAYAGLFDETMILGHLGRPWYYLDPGVVIKPYPSGALAHPAMHALTQLIHDHDVKPEQVEKVTVGVNALVPDSLNHHQPKNAHTARYSMEYSMATLLARRRAGIAEYTRGSVEAPAVQMLMPKVEMNVDGAAESAGYHRLVSRVTVLLRDGHVLTGEAEAARGHPRNPMTEDELLAKFRDCAMWSGRADGASNILHMVDHLEELESLEELCHSLL
jgi:2-methylcitrate dehydratase PrpD